jgi:hypothetical protein
MRLLVEWMHTINNAHEAAVPPPSRLSPQRASLEH